MGTNPTQTLHQAIQNQFGLQNPSDSSKLSNVNHTTQHRFVIPRLLGAATGEPLNIPLLSRLERGVGQLQIRDDDGGDRASAMKTTQAPLIDLTSTVIAGSKDGPPKEAASKAREKLAASQQHFSIPFNPCDTVRRSPALSGGLLASRRSLPARDLDEDAAAAVPPPDSRPGPIGCMLDAIVGYPEPRQPQLQYAVTRLERRHLKMCSREDYGGQVKRFRFDTPSPDELVKQALQKSWRVTRT